MVVGRPWAAFLLLLLLQVKGMALLLVVLAAVACVEASSLAALVDVVEVGGAHPCSEEGGRLCVCV